jgi:hypothetical protein
MSRPQFLFALIASAAMAASDCAVGAVLYQTVALSGQHAPGTAASVTFTNFDLPSLNDTGQVTFSGHLTIGAGSATSLTDDVLYAGPVASLQLVARAGDPAPGMPAGVNYSLFNIDFQFQTATHLNDAGQIAYVARLTGSGVTTANRDLVYAGAAGSPQLVARAGDQATGLPAGVVYGGFGYLSLNESGQVAFVASLGGSGVSTAAGNYAASYVGTPGSLQLAARDGDPAPGTTANYGGNGGSMGALTFNDTGQIVFTDTLQAAGVTSTNGSALFAGAAGSVQIIARSGDAAPGAPAGVNYALLQAHSGVINNASQVAFPSRWSTGVGGVDSTNDDVLYAGPIAALQLLARAGNAAPGTSSGVSYSTFSIPILNDTGQVAFSSRLTGVGVTTANDRAIFAGPFASPQLMLREGDPAPGTAAGVNFSEEIGNPFPTWYPPPIMTFNDAGQVALQMNLAGSGVTTANDVALYLFDPILGPVMIAREGNLFDVGGGVFRTIADEGIQFAAGRNDDTINGLSNNGTLVFRLTFTNGSSGIFTANVPVPEPAALSLLALGTTVLHLRRRRTKAHETR